MYVRLIECWHWRGLWKVVTVELVDGARNAMPSLLRLDRKAPSNCAPEDFVLARFLHNLTTASVSMSRAKPYPSMVSRAKILKSLEAASMMGASEFEIPKCARSRYSIGFIPDDNISESQLMQC